MPKKPLQKRFVVIVDSNAIFTKDIARIAGNKFDLAWKECTHLADVSLRVPEVVKGERLYQLVTIAVQAIENAGKNFDTVFKVTALKAPTLPNLNEVKTGVEQRFEAWLRKYEAVVIDTPCDKVDWKHVVHAAIWRIAPFAQPSEAQDSEKGFRDRLILETVREIIRLEPKHEVAFISNDALLREAAKNEFDNKFLNTYEDMSAFASFLKLTHEKLNQEVAQLMIKIAPDVFYNPNNPECVYTKLSVFGRIINAFGLNLMFLPDTQPAIFGSQNGFHTPAGQEKLLIDGTDFIRVTNGNVFEWKTHLRLIRVFRLINAGVQPIIGFEWLNETIRIAKFDVVWSATIDDAGNFSSLAISNIFLVETLREAKTLWNMTEYGLTV